MLATSVVGVLERGTTTRRRRVATTRNRLASVADSVNNAPAVVLVEHQDPDGARWLAALTLLIEAGRVPEDEERG